MATEDPSRQRLVYEFKESPYSSHSLILSALPLDGGGLRVLDIGCANGYLASILAARGYQVVGVERPGGFGDDFPSNVQLIVADLDGGLPPMEGTFRYVLAADILEHLKDPSSLLLDLHRFVTPETQLIASLPNSGNLYFRLNVLAGRFPKEDRGLFDRTHLHFFMWSGWQTLFQEAGFRIQTVRSTGMPIGLAFPRAANSVAVRLAERVSYLLGRCWKTLFAYQFVVSAKPFKLHCSGDALAKE